MESCALATHQSHRSEPSRVLHRLCPESLCATRQYLLPSPKPCEPLAEMRVAELQSKKSPLKTLCLASHTLIPPRPRNSENCTRRDDQGRQTPDGTGTSVTAFMYHILHLPVKVKNRSNWADESRCISVRRWKHEYAAVLKDLVYADLRRFPTGYRLPTTDSSPQRPPRDAEKIVNHQSSIQRQPRPPKPGGRQRDPKREVSRLGTQTIAQPFMAGSLGQKDK